MRNRFFKWCSSSLRGHVALFELLCAVPLILWSLVTMRSERTLTTVQGLRITFLCVVLVAIGAALFWYAVSLPLLKSRSGRQ